MSLVVASLVAGQPGCSLDRSPIRLVGETRIQGCFERVGSSDTIFIFRQQISDNLHGTGSGIDSRLGDTWSFTGRLASERTANISVEMLGGGVRTFRVSYAEPNLSFDDVPVILTPCVSGGP